MKIRNDRLHLKTEPVSKTVDVKNNNQGSNNKNKFSEMFEKELIEYRNKNRGSQC